MQIVAGLFIGVITTFALLAIYGEWQASRGRKRSPEKQAWLDLQERLRQLPRPYQKIQAVFQCGDYRMALQWDDELRRLSIVELKVNREAASWTPWKAPPYAQIGATQAYATLFELMSALPDSEAVNRALQDVSAATVAK